MNTLNLINPAHSDLAFTAIVFPDGQPHLRLDAASVATMDKDAPIRILTRLASPADLLLALFAKSTLDYLEFSHIELHVSYLLAARMDRVMQEGEPFSLKVVAGLMNTGNFRKVRIFDPHSEVSAALIDRSYPVTNHRFVQDALAHYMHENPVDKYCLVSPDAGALKKIHSLARFLDIDDVVEGMKERDLKTGALTNFRTTREDLTGITCFIVDDICDGGGTFAGTAKMLRDIGATTVVLIVSHGIFSKGIAVPGVDMIYCTDSYRVVDGVACFPVEHYL
jgi:ribose-phosphate pyrophosphokinase